MILLPLLMLASFAVIILSHLRYQKRLPPGPRRLPILGNIHQIPTTNPWKTFQQWHKAYGPVVSLKLGQKNVIIIGDYEVARELLDKRREKYSSRPALVLNDGMTKGLHMAFMPYGEKWKKHHRMHTSFLNTRMSQRYRYLQDIESKQLLHDMLDSDDFPMHVRRYSSSVSFALAHGKRLATNDREIADVESVTDRVVSIFHESGIVLVELFPVLNYLPHRLASWKRMGDDFHRYVVQFYTKNMISAVQQKSWNWSKESLRLKKAQSFSMNEIAYMTGVLHSGNEVTQAVFGVFVMACLLYPDTMHRAQAELDQSVGSDRLPTFEDAPRLPYLSAFISEALRWKSPTPLGVPHATSEEDEFMGYHIPKGTTVLANHWAMDHDEEQFENPEEFQPERWLKNPKLPQIAFGWGRRVCLGQHMGRNSLFVVISRLLWGFEIGCSDEKKAKISSWEMAQSLTSGPSECNASFCPRTEGHHEVIKREFAAAETDTDTILASIWPKESEW